MMCATCNITYYQYIFRKLVNCNMRTLTTFNKWLCVVLLGILTQKKKFDLEFLFYQSINNNCILYLCRFFFLVSSLLKKKSMIEQLRKKTFENSPRENNEDLLALGKGQQNIQHWHILTIFKTMHDHNQKRQNWIETTECNQIILSYTCHTT